MRTTSGLRRAEPAFNTRFIARAEPQRTRNGREWANPESEVPQAQNGLLVALGVIVTLVRRAGGHIAQRIVESSG